MTDTFLLQVDTSVKEVSWYDRVVKSYREFCAAAKTLDVVGDRWALLVVRELLPGPRRYTDLLEGLPGIGTNVLSIRLRELEESGILTRRRLPAPSAATVYELTDDGRDLLEVVQALSRWGMRRITRPEDDEYVEPRWFVGSLTAVADASPLADSATYALRIDGEDFTLEVDAGRLIVSHGVVGAPQVMLVAALSDFFAVAKGDRKAAKRVGIEGDRAAGKELLGVITGATVRPGAAA
jgi:DNA-binding HxlR family transcriptional regulator